MIRLKHITCRFGAVTALDDVSLDIRPGAVLGLLGENGAGKTTLMNVLYGLVRADAGNMAIESRPYLPRSPREAIARGVGMVHQHFMLVPTLTVAENVVLGVPRHRWLSPRRIADEIARFAAQLSLPVHPSAAVSTLSVGQRQRVEILKALYRGVRVLILDEPTAVLTPSESEQLFAALRGLREQGVTVIFISHKLREIVGHCDDVAVLRRGRRVHFGPAAGATESQLAEWMVGEPVARARQKAISMAGSPVASPATLADDPSSHCDSGPARVRGGDRTGAGAVGSDRGDLPPALQLRGLCVANPNAARGSAGRPVLDHVNLAVAAGEIFGLAGVDGNGQDVLVDTLLGVRRATTGSILIAGRDVSAWAIAARIGAGVAHISGDRQREGLVMDFDLAENAALKRFASKSLARVGWFLRQRATADAQRLIREFDVRTPSPRVAVRTLSGGNQQKLVAGRELNGSPVVVIAVNPTRGVDVSASANIRGRLAEAASGGAGVLLISTDLDEIIELSDRIAVVLDGRVRMTEWPRSGVDEIGRFMAGID